MHPPLLSVIIPTYNSDKHISACLDSIADQSFKNFEVIVIDGASTDRTVDILRKYAALHPNISYITERDNGIYHAMNKGIKISKGTWLYFIGSDDRLYDNEIFENLSPCFYSGHDVVYGNVESDMLGGNYDGEFTIEKMFSKNICQQSIFVKRSVFKQTGLFNTHFKAHADWHHNLKWMRDDEIKKLYVNTVVAHFSSGGLSSQYKDRVLEHLINWEKAKYQKKQISRTNRLRMIKAGLKHAFSENSRLLFFKIITDSPLFII